VPVYHTLGLNVALVSYDGGVHVGLTADRDLVPDLDRFGAQLHGAAAEYLAIAERLRRPFTRRAARGRGARRPPG
jgi:hypothetical protein